MNVKNRSLWSNVATTQVAEELQPIHQTNDRNTVYHQSPQNSIAPTISRYNRKNIAANFDGGKLTSDAGALFLPLADKKLRLTERIDNIVHDPRDPRYISHKQRELFTQRIYGIALGYEDGNDHQQLRKDPALRTAIKNSTDEELPLGSAPTLSRLENRITKEEIAALSQLFVELFIESYKEPPKQSTIDVDATDDMIHGNQEGRHFNGFYDGYCFLPLYFFVGHQLLWTQLRTSDKGGAHGTRAIFHYLTQRIKQAFPDCEIILRGDAGCYSPGLLNYCERYGYKYILGIPSHAALEKLFSNIIFAAEMFFGSSGSQERFRLFWENAYRARSWKTPRRIIVKAERLPDGNKIVGKENTRYLVTNLEGTPQELYEKVYCARGDMENRIKEVQLMLFSDRTSCHSFLANRVRLFFSCCAYVLMETIRRTALHGTSMSTAQCSTIRSKLFKIAAVVKESVRRIAFSLPSSCPVQDLWLRVFDRLRLERLYEVLPLPSG